MQDHHAASTVPDISNVHHTCWPQLRLTVFAKIGFIFMRPPCK